MNIHFPQTTKQRALATLGVLAGLAVAAFIGRSIVSAWTAPTFEEVVERHLESARQEAEAGLAPQFKVIREFFKEASLGTRPFAEDALGFDSKWALIQEYFFDDDAHRAYLEERFAARIFKTEDLEQTVRYAVSAYLNHLDSVDAAFLVNLKVDMDDLPQSSFPPGVDRTAIEQSLAAAIHNTVGAVGAEFPRAVGLELASYVAGEVLTYAGVELATSAGILSVGAGSGTVTFGVGIVVGVIADAIISRVYNEMFDPAGELSRKLDDTLGNLKHLILSGDGEQPGLSQRLHDYAARRAEARRAAINAALSQAGTPGV